MTGRILFAASLMSLLFCANAFAEGNNKGEGNKKCSSGACPDFFSPPADARKEVPSFKQGPMGGGMRGKFQGQGGFGQAGGFGGGGFGGGFRGGGDGMPDFQQVKMIPSLSREQRSQLHDIYQKARTDIQPVMDQMKALKEQVGQDREAAMRNPELREKFQSLRQQLHAKREATWKLAKAQLSEKQLGELEQMKKGELVIGGGDGNSSQGPGRFGQDRPFFKGQRQGFGQSGQGFGPPGQGFGPPGQGFGPPGQGFGPPGQGFGPPGQGFGPPGQGFGPPGQGSGQPGQGFGPPGQGSGQPGQGFGPPGQGDFGPRGQGFGPRDGSGPFGFRPRQGPGQVAGQERMKGELQVEQ